MDDIDKRLAKAVKHFWRKRAGQSKSAGGKSGRDAVVGGAQMDGFTDLVRALLVESGLPDAVIHKRSQTLPGYFRASKDWDLVVVVDGTLLATVEFKSQVGSFGNNYNNRSEEAIGNATDFYTAYREGAFRESSRPWLGWLMLLEDAPGSRTPIAVKEPFFPVFADFRGASYAKRYELLCKRLVRERLYDAACLILSERKAGLRGGYSEPSAEIGFRNFVASLMAKAVSYAKTRR
ncbi:MAG: PaeR7I family type II restriction endonuclease [Phycisphaeraceae bacterium]